MPSADDFKLTFALDGSRSDATEFVFMQELITTVAVGLGRTPSWDGFLPSDDAKVDSNGVVLVAFATAANVKEMTTKFAEVSQTDGFPCEPF